MLMGQEPDDIWIRGSEDSLGHWGLDVAKIGLKLHSQVADDEEAMSH